MLVMPPMQTVIDSEGGCGLIDPLVHAIRSSPQGDPSVFTDSQTGFWHTKGTAAVLSGGMCPEQT
jgi:hypothetical protein